MSKQNIEYLFRLQFPQSFHDALCEINVGLDGHLESETVGEIYCFSYGFECDCILLGN